MIDSGSDLSVIWMTVKRRGTCDQSQRGGKLKWACWDMFEWRKVSEVLCWVVSNSIVVRPCWQLLSYPVVVTLPRASSESVSFLLKSWENSLWNVVRCDRAAGFILMLWSTCHVYPSVQKVLWHPIDPPALLTRCQRAAVQTVFKC